MTIERMIDTQNGGCWILEIHDLGPSPLEGKRVGFEITLPGPAREKAHALYERARLELSSRCAVSLEYRLVSAYCDGRGKKTLADFLAEVKP